MFIDQSMFFVTVFALDYYLVVYLKKTLLQGSNFWCLRETFRTKATRLNIQQTIRNTKGAKVISAMCTLTRFCQKFFA